MAKNCIGFTQKENQDSTGKRKGKSRLEYNWPKIRKEIDEQLKTLDKRDIKPTIRQLYYILSTLKGEGIVLPGIKKTYQALSQYMTDVRENGDLPMDCVIDERHHMVDIQDAYISPEEWIQYYIDKLRDIEEKYHDEGEEDYRFPRWYKQENYVEIWTEKEAMTKEFNNVVYNEDLQVRIVPFGGNAGTTILNECVVRLKKKMNLGMSVRILYFGDFDPSGEMMDEATTNRLINVPVWKISKYAADRGLVFDFQRIAITKKQIKDYNLPWDPLQMSDEQQKKIEDDPRYKNHLIEHGQAYAASLDSFPTLHLDEFNKLVVDSVNQYFDNNVYKQVLKEHKKTYNEEYIKNKRNYFVKQFSEELNGE